MGNTEPTKNGRTNGHTIEFEQKRTLTLIENVACSFNQDKIKFGTLGLYLVLLDKLSRHDMFGKVSYKIQNLISYYKNHHPELASELNYNGKNILTSLEDLSAILINSDNTGLTIFDDVYKKRRRKEDLNTAFIRNAFKIGKGGQANVSQCFIAGNKSISDKYCAGGIFAIKTSIDDTIESLVQTMGEVKIQATHYWGPYMVPAIAVVQMPGSIHRKSIVLPYVPGNDLKSMIFKNQDYLYAAKHNLLPKNIPYDDNSSNDGRIRLMDFFNFIFQGIKPIHYMAKNKFILRDINPSNYLCIWSKKGSVFFLMDPGSALLQSDISKRPPSATLAFSPYEATHFIQPDGPRIQQYKLLTSDVASYALVVHYMLTGQREVFKSKNIEHFANECKKGIKTIDGKRDLNKYYDLLDGIYDDFKRNYKKNSNQLKLYAPYLTQLIGSKNMDIFDNALYSLFNPELNSRKSLNNFLSISYQIYNFILKKDKNALKEPLKWDLNLIKQTTPQEYTEIHNRYLEYLSSIAIILPSDNLASSQPNERRAQSKDAKPIAVTQTQIKDLNYEDTLAE